MDSSTLIAAMAERNKLKAALAEFKKQRDEAQAHLDADHLGWSGRLHSAKENIDKTAAALDVIETEIADSTTIWIHRLAMSFL